jgi:hypothetical protein
MKTTLQARLDRRTQVLLDRLVRHTGWSQPRVLREAVTLLGARFGLSPRKRIIGVGRFASGISSQGSNTKHLNGFGRRSLLS